MNRPEKRVLVGMSGGIDSTATCLILQEQGYEIVGVTMRVWGDEPQDARELAARMGIEHYVADERIPFKETIVKNFIDEYKQGRTPNPCGMCNPLFKFRVLTEWADKLNCAWVATGHYSRLEEKSGNIYIVAGDDDKKDQSYFLWRLGQDVLKRCIFPLGDYTKVKVREYLAEKGYETKSKEGESMEVCFIKGDYRDFLREQCPELDSEIGPGWFVNSEGVKLGKHKGAPYYNVDFIGGFDLVLNDQTRTPDYYINFPPYNKDGVVWCNITGHSMEPELNNGDFIAMKEMYSPIEYLPAGEIYGIVTDDYRTVKRIQLSEKEGFVRLIPTNKSPEYKTQDIPISMIRKVYAVLGSMHRVF